MIAAKDRFGVVRRKHRQVQKARDILPVQASSFGKLPHRADFTLDDPFVPGLRLCDCPDETGNGFGVLLGARRQDQSNFGAPFREVARRPECDRVLATLTAGAQQLGAKLHAGHAVS